MRRLPLVVFLLLAAAQAYTAVRWTRYEWFYTSARAKDDAGDFLAGVDLMERASLAKPDAARARVWTGDIALRYLAATAGRLAPADEKAILDRAWAGYAGAVAIAPLDSWCWSGAAEVAVRQAQLDDRVKGVSLDVLAARSSGVLDPWRAMALGAAQLAVKISPAGYPELDVLASVYESAGEVERAAETYVRSARLMSMPSFHVWGKGRTFAAPIYERLLAGLVAGIANAPAYDRSLFHTEVARFAREQSDSATAAVQARLAEQTARNRYERYRAAMELGRALIACQPPQPEEALAAFRRAEATGYDAGAVARILAELELRLGLFRDACAHARAAVRDDALDAAMRIQAADACERAKEIDAAEQLLSEGLVDPVAAMPIAEALVAFLERNGRTLTARSLVSRWLREYPNQVEFRAWMVRLADAPVVSPPPS